MAKKFGILRLIGTIYRVFGILLAILAVLAAAAACLIGIVGGSDMSSFGREMGMNMGASGPLGGILSGLVILITLGIAAITQYAIGEAIYLFLSIEENTRATAAFLARQNSAPEA